MKPIELTQHDGLKIGIPPMTAILLVGLTAKPNPEFPDGKTMIRYSLGTGARHAYVRDTLKHVKSLFPRASGGLGWLETKDAVGNELCFPEGTLNAYRQLPDGQGFEISINCETGPIELAIQEDYDGVLALMGETPPAPRQKRRGAAAT